MKTKICLLTVGHAPRDDLLPDLAPMLSENIGYYEAGGLDGYTVEEIHRAFDPSPGEKTLVTRLAGGSMATLSSDKVLPLVQKRILLAAEEGAKGVVILCTSRFPVFSSKVPLIVPFDLMHSLLPPMVRELKVGAVFPFEPYAESMKAEWNEAGLDPVYRCKAPAAVRHGREIAELFAGEDIEFLILDCIGFTGKQRRQAEEALGIPVIQPKRVIAGTVNCLFG
jgi:protein AroM